MLKVALEYKTIIDEYIMQYNCLYLVVALTIDSITQDGWDILNCLKDMEHIFNDVIITIIK